MNFELKKILVVDDAELLHRLYEFLFVKFKGKGLQILHAYNGAEGLEALGANPDIEMVLLDVHMPVMNGIEFLGHVKADPRYRKIPVIVISTKGKEEDTAKAVEAGAGGYVTKPFQPQELLALMSRLHEGAAAGAHPRNGLGGAAGRAAQGA